MPFSCDNCDWIGTIANLGKDLDIECPACGHIICTFAEAGKATRGDVS